MRLFFKGEYRVTQRAAWPLSYVVRRHPELIIPYFGKLLDNLDKGGLHIAVVRNSIRLLQDVDIPAKFHGRVMNRCFEYAGNPATPIAVKAFSLTVLQNLSQKYPDILPELKLIIREQWDQAPPAFRVRAKRILKDLH
ncbi:MAG TPA: hypothetical protein VHC48_18810, partial [Puia sp.]|nr:hypothetical protein [Puia sp.]